MIRHTGLAGVGWAAVLAASVAGCGGDPPFQAPAAPLVVRFVARPSSVAVGGRATLSWEVRDADRVEVGPAGRARLVVDGSPIGEVQTEALTEDTAFELRATGAGGQVEAQLTVRVADMPPVVDRFDVEPDRVAPGEPALVRWVVRGATSVRVDAEPGGTIVSDGDASGSVTVSPTRTSTYTLTGFGPRGTAQASVRLDVTLPRPEIRSFDVEPTAIFEGERFKVAWSTRYADRVRIGTADGTPLAEGGPEGSDELTLFESATLVLEALGAAGVSTATRALTVREPRPVEIVSFTAEPNPVAIGGTTTLRWSVQGTTELAVSGEGRVLVADDAPAPTGQLIRTITGPETIYELFAQGPLGSETATVVVLGHPAPSFVKLTVDPAALAAPGTSLVGWIVDGVTELALTANGQPVPGFPGVPTSSRAISTQGELPVAVERPTRFEMTARSAGGTASRQVLAIIGREEAEPNASAPQAMTLTGTAGAVLGSAGPLDEDWYRVTIPAAGALRAETSFGPGACATDTTLSLIAPDGATVLATDDDDGFGRCSLLAPDRDPGVSALAAGTYFVVVAAAPQGAYTLAFAIDAPVCGDGAREGSEACDDGNRAGADGCSASCRLELAGTLTAAGGARAVTLPRPPGFGTVAIDLDRPGQSITATAADPGAVSCAAVDTQLALLDPTFAELGRRRDGGPTGPAGACAALDPRRDRFARDLAPGRYYLVASSEGTTGGTIEVRASVRNPQCGNGLVEQRAGEQCDDGNRTSADGCSSQCAREVRRILETEPNDTQGTANLTGLSGPGGITIAGANTPAGDDDVYRLDLAAGRSVVLSARTYTTPSLPTSCTSTVTDTRIYVERAGAPAIQPGVQPIAFNDDIDNTNNVWCSEVRGVTLSGGTSGASFFVRVQGWNDQRLTTYELDLTLSP